MATIFFFGQNPQFAVGLGSALLDKCQGINEMLEIT